MKLCSQVEAIEIFLTRVVPHSRSHKGGQPHLSPVYISTHSLLGGVANGVTTSSPLLPGVRSSLNGHETQLAKGLISPLELRLRGFLWLVLEGLYLDYDWFIGPEMCLPFSPVNLHRSFSKSIYFFVGRWPKWTDLFMCVLNKLLSRTLNFCACLCICLCVQIIIPHFKICLVIIG